MNVDQPLIQLLLAVADDKLMLGHRNSDWTGLAPMLEEDIAFSSIAQDEIAHAQALYELAAERAGTTADGLAFGRDAAAYRCAAIVEVPDEFDWATALVRRLFCDHFDALRLPRLAKSADKRLAALAARLAAEEQVHVEHVDGWMLRLGRGTNEARDRLQHAIDALTPLAPMLFEPVEGEARLAADGLYPADGDMFENWRDALADVTGRAGLQVVLEPPGAQVGGRRGRHTAHLGALLDEMCEVYRLAPGAAW